MDNVQERSPQGPAFLDNDDAVTGSSEDIGEIKITVTRTRLMDRRPLKISLGSPQERVFHEKSKKGALVAHQTRC